MKHCADVTVLSVCVGIGLGLVTAQSQAHLPALYGKEFVRFSPAATSVPPPLSPNSTSDTPDNKAGVPEDYVALLEREEESSGPYSDTLAEPLLSLGRYYYEQGEHAQALNYYGRALHVVRVNDGLGSDRQVPLVQEMITVYRSQNDLEAMDKAYDYLFRLYGSGEPPFSPQAVKANREYLKWQREAWYSDVDGRGNSRLLELYLLNQRMLSTTEAGLFESEALIDEYRDLTLSQLRNLYLLLGEQLYEGQAFDLPASGRIHSSQSKSPEYVKQRIATIQHTGLKRGRSLLEDLQAQLVERPAAERAAICLELGDWLQWNGETRAAVEEYEKVVDILSGAGETKLLEQWLALPAELPVDDFIWERVPGAGLETAIATAKYDVSAKGEVLNVHVSAIEGGDDTAARIKRMLVETHFRPRFVAGHAEPVEALFRHYELVD